MTTSTASPKKHDKFIKGCLYSNNKIVVLCTSYEGSSKFQGTIIHVYSDAINSLYRLASIGDQMEFYINEFFVYPGEVTLKS